MEKGKRGNTVMPGHMGLYKLANEGPTGVPCGDVDSPYNSANIRGEHASATGSPEHEHSLLIVPRSSKPEQEHLVRSD